MQITSAKSLLNEVLIKKKLTIDNGFRNASEVIIIGQAVAQL